MTQKNEENRIGRREFLAGAATTAAAFTMIRPSAVRGTTANSTLEAGLIGCGGRGTWIVDLFHKHGKYKFVACADYYPKQADALGDKFGIDPSRRYTTLSGYKKLLDGKLDVAVIETPPYFHPEQAAAAVDAGKHVFLAKPIAVDVPGCRLIAKSGKKATEKKLVYLVDFQTRAHASYREAARKIHAGELGRLICGDAHYPCGHIAMEKPQDAEDRLRRWYCDRTISGDFIVEQSIHALDVATWFLDAAPVKACGTGGSKGLRPYGNVWDHFNLVYWFPKDVPVNFYSVQMAHGSPNEIICRIYGEKGTVDSDYFEHIWIHGPKPWDGGKWGVMDMYGGSCEVNIKEFYEAVSGGDYSNKTVEPSVRSNLTAILGRTAAYKGGEATWEDMMKTAEVWKADLSGLKA